MTRTKPPLPQLRALLRHHRPGPVSDPATVVEALAAVWPHLEGSGGGGMHAGKVRLERLEGFAWSPPHLRFAVERHGGTVHGSTRAEVQYWAVDLDAGTAEMERTRSRQIRPPAPRFNAASYASGVVRAAVAGEAHPALGRLPSGALQVVFDRVPELSQGFAQTLASRRKKFCSALRAGFEKAGWLQTDRYGYLWQPPGSGPRGRPDQQVTARPITHDHLRGLPGLRRSAADAVVEAQPRTVREALRLTGVGRRTTRELLEAGLLSDPDGAQRRVL